LPSRVGWRSNIRSGLGWPCGRSQPVLTGTLGEGPGRIPREGCVRVKSLGISVVESPCAVDESVVGRVSVADASLSLSLSLWSGLRLSGRSLRPVLTGRPGCPAGGEGSAGRLGFVPPRRGETAANFGYSARLGLSRVSVARSAFCSSHAACQAPAVCSCCPLAGRYRSGVSREGMVR
jgi:hypothetical protein